VTVDRSTFDREFLRRLEHLPRRLARFRASTFEGSLSLRGGGASLEFAGHRPYVSGDDVRRIDWNAYARLRRPMVKELAREGGPDVLVAVDASGSMRLLEKDRAASRIAAVLARLTLARGGRLRLAFVSAAGAVVERPLRGDPDRNFPLALEFLSRWPQESGGADLAAGFGDALAAGGARASVWVVSDFWLGPESRRRLAGAATSGREITLVHVLSKFESDPSLLLAGRHDGAVRLVDSETGARSTLRIGGEDEGAYRRRVDDFVVGLRAFALRHRLRYRFVSAESPLPGSAMSLFVSSGGR
jgi:uncharacterized protein DUF58